MKQGKASVSGPGDRKVEPKPHAVNPGGADALGQVVGKGSQTPLFAGRGFQAPSGTGMSVMKSGSQGKH